VWPEFSDAALAEVRTGDTSTVGTGH
jgi:hypothetical protein